MSQAIPYIKKRIGQSYLVWFQNSNTFTQLEEPAWFVFRKIIKRSKTETIATEFSIRYCNTHEESITFVKEIRSQIEKMNQSDKTQDEIEKYSEELKEHIIAPFSIHRYRLGNKVISIFYESSYFENFLHPLIKHFETKDENMEMPLFELFACDQNIVFRYNGVVKGMWTRDETHLVKGLIFKFLLNVLHDKTDDDWLMTVHASAITNGKKTILFSAPPGNGKTTIAALLQAQGFTLISDDFVPIDRQSFKAYPFPIAMSVKESSKELLDSLFPAFEQTPLKYISPEKSVRYLPLNLDLDVTKEIFPVQEFVFVEYNSEVDFSFDKQDLLKALKLLFDQAWVTPIPGNAALFFERILQISFYKLTYSNNQKAIDAITHLFGNNVPN